METKQIEKMTDEEYFALKALSASQIKQYDKGAYWFWKSSPFNPDKEPEKASDALSFGKLCHCMLLEPDAVAERFMVVDFGKTRTTKKYAEAVETYPGFEIVTQDEMDRAKKMIEEIGKHPLASRIIAGATAEMPYTWTDKDTGLPCKCKIDAIKRTKNGIVVIDYKTSSDIQSVLNWPQKLQYPLQAEFYSRAVKEKYGEDPCEFIFIIQSNKEGEEDVIAVANVEYDTGLVAKDIVKSHMASIATKLEMWNESHDKSIWAAYPNRVEMRYSNWYMDRGE
jgi:ATP-dependent exoDNAse (exonuclease V) beta subunit